MCRITILFLVLPLLLSCNVKESGNSEDSKNTLPIYTQNRVPLKARAYLELPLGAIIPQDWLEEQLQRMASGLTGNLDSIYPEVVGVRNGWLGGDGDGWERGPYWIDGLLPLAYILDDESLKSKVQPWVEWTIQNQTAEGYIGPIPFETEPDHEDGLQRGKRKDWWPKMVMLKILRQYYSATKDERVIETLSNYFRYQLRELPKRPLDADSFWANRRGADNLQVVYWLYNITGDLFLLELADIIHEQTFPWTDVFLNDSKAGDSIVPYSFFKMSGYPFDSSEIKNTSISQIGSIHTVNLAQALKQPIIRYQQDSDAKYIHATKKALLDIETYHGQAQGMYGGDEPLHGSDPVQGVEFCAISEEMFSLETILQITGDVEFADLLERITYNALPAQTSDDFTSRQYFQAANQVQLSDQLQTSYETKNHKGTDFVFGILTGYPCCTTNMHQSWPKYVQNLFYATADGGVAALLYGPSQVKMKVANHVELKIIEKTGFPFREMVNFEVQLSQSASFPFHLRIPSWTSSPVIMVNGKELDFVINKGIVVLDRLWSDGDVVKLQLPMEIKTSKWHQDAIAVERGPLVYSLKIDSEEKTKNRQDGYGTFSEFFPKEDWNYALIKSQFGNLPSSIETNIHEWDGKYPWSIENAPLSLKVKAVQIPEWKLIDGAPIFPSQETINKSDFTEEKEILLIPYGCTILRITEFPVIDPE